MEGGEAMDSCQLCNVMVPGKKLRWHNLKEHCMGKVVTCSICEEKLVSETALESHILKNHRETRSSVCIMCDKPFSNTWKQLIFSIQI